MPTFDRIQKTELLSSAPLVTFSDIPQTYDDLFIIANVRSERSGVNADGLAFYFNSQTTGNTARWGYNVGSTTYNYLQPAGVGIGAGNIGATTSVANAYSPVLIHIPNYRSSVKKVCFTHSAWTNNVSSGMGSHVIAGLSPLTSAITSITIFAGSANLSPGSTFSLFGMSSDQTTSTKASGGFIEKFVGYTYHEFTGTNTLTVSETINVEYLIVAGGGGGGAGCCGAGEGEAGGGGAGGMLTGTTTLSPGNYTITVGAGGSGAAINTQLSGSDGSNSSAFSLTAIGGGGGGGRGTPAGTLDRIGRPGGSGGGSGQRDASSPDYFGLGTTGQGNRGGRGLFSTSSPVSSGGGGGGGAGSVGQDCTNAFRGGDGGIGAIWPTDGTGKYYAGGGGGSSYGYGSATVPGQGGLGGGGNGTWNNAPTSGKAFTGGGGGGGGGDTNGYAGARGGSGIVIIRYT